MFAVLYEFRVKENQHTAFVDGWRGLTELIYKHEGSLGSRLHHVEQDLYLAYARWPDRDTWENSGNRLPPEADQFAKAMRDACYEIKTKHTMLIESDYLKE